MVGSGVLVENRVDEGLGVVRDALVHRLDVGVNKENLDIFLQSDQAPPDVLRAGR